MFLHLERMTEIKECLVPKLLFGLSQKTNWLARIKLVRVKIFLAKSK